MGKRYNNQATDEIWIIVTVLVRGTTVRMVVKEPKNLKPNEYAYHFKITTNFKDWEDRIEDMGTLKPVVPKRSGTLATPSSKIGDSVEDQVTKALTQ